VTVAEVNKKLSLILSTKKRKKSANVTSLLTANMPKGHGQKGGTAPQLQKTSQPDTAKIKINVPSTPITETESSNSATQPATLPHAEGFSFTSGPAAPPLNMVQSPVYGNRVQSPMYSTSPMYVHNVLAILPRGIGYPFQPNPARFLETELVSRCDWPYSAI